MRLIIMLTLVAIAALLFIAAPASADVVGSEFSAELDATGGLVSGGPGSWYQYPNFPNWWNQWFYNDEYDPDRWKRAKIEFTITPTMPYPNTVALVTINWSTAQWSEDYPGEGPPLPDPDGPITVDNEYLYVGRVEPELLWSLIDGEYVYNGDWTEWKILVPDYNPEWVSIDIAGANYIITGTLWHECVPEPATMALLCLGGIGLLLRRRRKA